jgi:hypothetical protein
MAKRRPKSRKRRAKKKTVPCACGHSSASHGSPGCEDCDCAEFQAVKKVKLRKGKGKVTKLVVRRGMPLSRAREDELVAGEYMQRTQQCSCGHDRFSHPGAAACTAEDCGCRKYNPVYRVNPGDDMYEMNPYGESPLQSYSMPSQNPQTYWGAGSGIYDGRGRWRPGGGRYLDPRDMSRPPYEYHPGGGFRHHGFHPGAGYNANPYGESPLGSYSMPTRANWERPCARCGKYDCDCGCGGNPARCTCREDTWPYGAPIQRRRNPEHEGNPPPLYGYGHLPYSSPIGPGLVAAAANPYGESPLGNYASPYSSNPYGESPLQSYSMPSSNPQTYWGAGGGHYHRGDRWHPGGGRYLDPRDLPRPPRDYHPGGGHRSHGDGFFPGAGYVANPDANPDDDELVQCSLCEKIVRHEDSYSPFDEAICEVCAGEIGWLKARKTKRGRRAFLRRPYDLYGNPPRGARCPTCGT